MKNNGAKVSEIEDNGAVVLIFMPMTQMEINSIYGVADPSNLSFN